MAEGRHKVFIRRADATAADVALRLAEGAEAVGLKPRWGERWAVKLNLTYPSYLPGVVNAPAFVDGLCIWARECGVRICFVEGDGGNGAYSARDAFEGNGVSGTAARYGMTCRSLSEKPWEWRETTIGDRTVRLPYSPFFRRHEYDRFITAPLFKNHIFTVASLGMKNLWGCLPDAYRMYYHHVLDAGIVALYKELRPDFSIFDGLVAMRGRGPMEGRPLAMNAVMLASNVVAGERAALDVMGVRLEEVRHLQLAEREGLLPPVEELEWAGDPAEFRRTDFVVERTWLNRLSVWLAARPHLQRLVYHSPLSPGLYGIVNRIRGDSAQTRLYRARREGRYKSVSLENR
jgi:uncharacterized protein (DUF362 family)